MMSRFSLVSFFGGVFRRTAPIFKLQADLSDQDQFYDLPYPLDLRLNASGRPDLRGFPILDVNPVIRNLKKIADDSPGFPIISAGYFRFNFAIAERNPTDVMPADISSPILLIDVDAHSPERGKLYPTVASTPHPDLSYVPAFLLAVGPAPGIILHPKRQYAYVIQRSLRDKLGRPVRTTKFIQRLLMGRPPSQPNADKIYKIYQSLRQTLDLIGLSRREIATATVFTTGDPVGEMFRLSQQVLDQYELTVENLRLAPGVSHERFWELRGDIEMPQFQEGTKPFFKKGLFQVSAAGQLVEQRRESIPIVITIPKTLPMPEEGFPLMLYEHGSNGLSTQVVDRGPILEPGGEPQLGLGPAHVVAEFGIATTSSALPLNPERFRFAEDFPDAYLNFLNLAAYRDTMRQGAIEQRLLIKALENVTIPAGLIPGSTAEITLDLSSLVVLGQSLGSQFANMLGAIEPKVKAVIPTGAPGLWPLLIPSTNFSEEAGLFLGTVQPLDLLYPGLHLLSTAWEVVDPIVYTPYIGQRPLTNQPVRSIYMPVGQGDTEVPEAVFNAMVLALGLKQAGPIIWPQMQDTLALDGLDGIEPYPVVNNLRSDNGRPYTGGVVQYQGDGIADSHTIFSQLDGVKFQYGNFIRTLLDEAVAQVLEP